MRVNAVSAARARSCSRVVSALFAIVAVRVSAVVAASAVASEEIATLYFVISVLVFVPCVALSVFAWAGVFCFTV